MAGRVSMTTKGELSAVIGDRYRASGRAERTKILDEFVAVAVTGYHRKHAIRLLRRRREWVIRMVAAAPSGSACARAPRTYSGTSDAPPALPRPHQAHHRHLSLSSHSYRAQRASRSLPAGRADHHPGSCMTNLVTTCRESLRKGLRYS